MQEWTELNNSYWKTIENDSEQIVYSYRPGSKTLRLCLSEDVIKENDLDKYPVRVFTNKHCTSLLLKRTPLAGYKPKRSRHRYYLTFRFPEGIIHTKPGCPEPAHFETVPEGVLINF